MEARGTAESSNLKIFVMGEVVWKWSLDGSILGSASCDILGGSNQCELTRRRVSVPECKCDKWMLGSCATCVGAELEFVGRGDCKTQWRG